VVRSKSELAIANMLWRMKLEYEYERPVEGEKVPGKARSQFSFRTRTPMRNLVLYDVVARA